MKIAIIGTGNLGLSIVEGLLTKIDGSQITATDRSTKRIDFLKDKGVTVSTDNIAAIKNSDIIIFALKPYVILTVIDELKEYFTEKHVVVSVAAGVAITDLEKHAAPFVNIFRVMPNVAASVAQSASCISRNMASDAALNKVAECFDLIGSTIIVREDLMESATILSGCGPAFVLRFIRAMVQAGIQIGFSSEMATQIANQTVKGAAEILLANGNHPEAEIDKVTTPKGVTITGLNEMEHYGFSAALIRGMLTAYNKIAEN
ncbi:MAG: pyrroline-5-carboxylate reductase [Salinivirgaceae bacterium]|jgi:pyrroline-5-carboxylate reductase|nr:pyrroline-5-carboxylate reductase [Salinivirgaceae bacterium]